MFSKHFLSNKTAICSVDLSCHVMSCHVMSCHVMLTCIDETIQVTEGR